MRPPAIMDCAYDCRSPGNAKAHFSFSFGTSLAVRPAPAPSWNRVLLVFCPHPVQRGPAFGLKVAEAVHIAAAGGAVTRGLPTVLPVRNSAIARRSGAVRLLAMVIIDPVSMAASTRSAVSALNESRFGARFVPLSWHCAQLRL